MTVRNLRWRFYKKTGGPRGIGLNCKDYQPGCMVCDSYQYLRDHGRFPTFEEVRAISDAHMGNPPPPEGSTP